MRIMKIDDPKMDALQQALPNQRAERIGFAGTGLTTGGI